MTEKRKFSGNMLVDNPQGKIRKRIDKILADFQTQISGNPAFCALVKPDETLVGFAAVCLNYEMGVELAEVVGKYVDPKYRGNGVGTELTNQVYRWTKNKGYDGLSGYVPCVFQVKTSGKRNRKKVQLSKVKPEMLEEGQYGSTSSIKPVLNNGPLWINSDCITCGRGNASQARFIDVNYYQLHQGTSVPEDFSDFVLIKNLEQLKNYAEQVLV